MSRYAQPMSQVLLEMKLIETTDTKIVTTVNSLKKNDIIRVGFDSSIKKGHEGRFKVTAHNVIRGGRVTKTTLQNLANPKGVKHFIYQYQGKQGAYFAIGDMGASMTSLVKENLEEGYEKEVLNVLSDAGIDGYFRNGKLYVDKRDAKDAKAALEDADNIIKLPKMVKEEVEDLDEAIKYTHAAVDKKGLVIGFASKESDAKDMARRNKGRVVTLTKPLAPKKGDMMVNRPLPDEMDKFPTNTSATQGKRMEEVEEAIDPADLDLDATDADKKAADKNIIMQMRKAMDVRGNMPIEFANGKKEKVDAKILDMMTKAHMKIQKPRDKEKFVAMISKSKRDMLNVAKKLSTLRAELDKDDVDTVMDVIKGLEKAVKTHQGQVATLKKDIKDDLDKEDEPIVKKVVKMLKKASGAHAGQAKDLEKAMTEEVELDEKNKLKPGAKFDFRLFDDEDSPGSDKANADMNKEIHKAVRMKDKETARKHMMKVQNKYSKHGATDTEPREVINQVLDAIFEMKEKFMSRRPSSKEVKMAIGIANDPRYKGGNMTGAVKAIEKIRDGLSKYPEVEDALRKANENLEEGAMKKVVTDVEDAMGPTKIRYKLKQKGGKFIVSVDSNDEEDAQKALKMHPLYVAGKLRVVPEELTNEENDMTKSLKDTIVEMWTDSITEKVEYVEYKFKNEKDAKAAKAYFDGIQLMSFDVNDDNIRGGELMVDAGSKDMTKYHKEVMKKFRPKVMTQEGFASDAQRKAAFASGYKEKGKKKKDKDEGNAFGAALEKARKNGEKTFTVAGKTYDVQTEKLVGGQKKLDKDNDGDIDGKDFAMLRKSKKKEQKEEFSTPEIERYLETKRNSLRDAILQVWGEKHTPGHDEDEKNEKKSLTKEKKNGIKKMTDTGKEVTPVETSVKMPKIKETKNKV